MQLQAYRAVKVWKQLDLGFRVSSRLIKEQEV